MYKGIYSYNHETNMERSWGTGNGGDLILYNGQQGGYLTFYNNQNWGYLTFYDIDSLRTIKK